MKIIALYRPLINLNLINLLHQAVSLIQGNNDLLVMLNTCNNSRNLLQLPEFDLSESFSDADPRL
jgi:hypothetical protein